MISGLPALLIASVCFGSAAILVRFATGLPPITLAFYRLVFSAIPVIGFASVTGRLRNIGRRNWLLVAVSGVALGLHFFTFIFAVQNTTVSNATFLVNTSPIFLAVLAPLAIKERTTLREALAVAFGISGIYVASQGGIQGPQRIALSMGDLSAVTSALLVSLYTLIGRHLRTSGLDATRYVTYVYSFATISALPLAGAFESPLFASISFGSLLAAIGLALIPTVMGHGLYNYSLGYVKAVSANLVPLLEPTIASTLALLLFGETPAYTQIFGYALIALSVVFVASGKR